jgi:hypothetical protein
MAKAPTKAAPAKAASKGKAPEPEPTKNLPAVKKATPQAIAVMAADVFKGDRSGLENVTANDVTIPRMTILQKLSPQLDKKKPEFIEGAEVGDFCDTGSMDVFRGEMDVIPVHYAMQYLEWAPRSSGKGLVKNHGTDDSILKQCTQDDKRKYWLKNGNYVAPTATYYCLNLSANNRRCFIPLTSSGLKVSRNWMTAITNERVSDGNGGEFMPPIYYRSWRATVIEMSNNDGDWFSWKFTPVDGGTILELDPDQGLLAEAREFYEQASNGLVIGNFSGMEQPADGGADPDGKM